MDQVTFKMTLMATTIKKRRYVRALHAVSCASLTMTGVVAASCPCSTHVEFIRSVTLLSTLNEYERFTIADALVPVVYSAGEVIIREGEAGQDFYFIEEGEVKATKSGVDGEVSRRLTRGDYFGELALINDSVRAVCGDACRMFVVLLRTHCTLYFMKMLGFASELCCARMPCWTLSPDAVPSP